MIGRSLFSPTSHATSIVFRRRDYPEKVSESLPQLVCGDLNISIVGEISDEKIVLQKVHRLDDDYTPTRVLYLSRSLTVATAEPRELAYREITSINGGAGGGA
jgi:hypothetical protein